MGWTPRSKSGSPPLGSRSCSDFFLLVFGSCRKHGAAGFSSTNQAFVTCTLFLKKKIKSPVHLVTCQLLSFLRLLCGLRTLACAQKYHGAAATFVSASTLYPDGLRISFMGCVRRRQELLNPTCTSK